MITLTLTEDQAAYLEAALEKAMDNEGDAEYYEQFAQLWDQLKEVTQPA